MGPTGLTCIRSDPDRQGDYLTENLNKGAISMAQKDCAIVTAFHFGCNNSIILIIVSHWYSIVINLRH